MTETCSACGAQASGRFCNQCGGALNAACRECGTALPKGSRFCNECGAPVSPAAPAPAAAPAARGPVLPWAVTGALLLALVAAFVYPRARTAGAGEPAAQAPFAPAGAGAADPAAGAAAPAGDPSSVDLSSMTPREAADRLFNRVMTSVANGDSAGARRFVPMAIQAYGMAQPLDVDGRYHLSGLHLLAGSPAAARAQADTILATGGPTHLFGLFTAAEAAEAQGRRDEAAGFYRRFLQAYDAEVAKQLPEYGEHAQGLPTMREQARRGAGS